MCVENFSDFFLLEMSYVSSSRMCGIQINMVLFKGVVKKLVILKAHA
jgi:hypothetical protein